MSSITEKLIERLVPDLKNTPAKDMVVLLLVGAGAGWFFANHQAKEEIRFLERQVEHLGVDKREMTQAHIATKAQIETLEASLSEQNDILIAANSEISDLTAKLNLPETLAARCALYDAQIAKVNRELSELTMELAMTSPSKVYPAPSEGAQSERDHPLYSRAIQKEQDAVTRLADLKKRSDDCLSSLQ